MGMTEIGNWGVDLKDVGAIYPMQGMESGMVLIGIILWVGWHIWQIKFEDATFDEKSAQMNGGGYD